MTFILKDLHIPLASPPILYCDNLSTLHMTVNPVFHARSKHIELDDHFLRERVALGLLITQHISTNDKIADLFTKPMSKAALGYFWTKLYLQPRHSLRESINTTQLGTVCGGQWSDKEIQNYWRDKPGYSHNTAYISGETLGDEGVSIATNSTQDGSSIDKKTPTKYKTSKSDSVNQITIDAFEINQTTIWKIVYHPIDFMAISCVLCLNRTLCIALCSRFFINKKIYSFHSNIFVFLKFSSLTPIKIRTYQPTNQLENQNQVSIASNLQPNYQILMKKLSNNEYQ